jgi:predicted outer membrane repeat protein
MNASRRRAPHHRPLPLAAALLSMFATSASVATNYVVNSTLDEDDFVTNGICETAAGNGICTLRAAFSESQADPADDAIFLPAGDFPVDNSIGGILAGDGELTISGVGPGITVVRDISGIPTLASFITHLNTLRLQRLTIKDFPGTAIRSSGPLFVTDAIFENNGSSGYEGGSIHSIASLAIERTAFANGLAARGGAIYHESGAFSCLRCVFEGGEAEEFGGALFLGFDATANIIDSSLFTDNRTPGTGGAIFYYRQNTVVPSTLRIVNSTFHANRAAGLGGAISAHTAGMVVLNSTITDNRADSDEDGTGTGGGIYTDVEGNLVSNSILAGNFATITIQNPFPAVWPWPQDCSGNFLGNGYNIVRNVFTNCPIGDTSCCTFTGGAPSTADPLLGPLTYGGGITRTRALAPGSPAINGGRPDGCVSGTGGFLVTDQRGAPRPIFGCDLGAFEYGSLIFDDSFENWNWKWSLVIP